MFYYSGIKKEIINTIKMIAIVTCGGMKEIEQPVFLENCVGSSQYQNLLDMIDAGEINGAENKLLEMIDVNQKEDLKLSLAVYYYLNTKEDIFLTDNNYSRQEIEEGINYILSIFGYSSLII